MARPRGRAGRERSYAEAARRELQRLEGKTYEVYDGDVVTVRFNA